MKITSIDIIRCKRMAFSAQTPVLCRINTDEGLYGYGEAGVSIMDFSLGAEALIRVLGQMILGMDPLQTDAIYEKLTATFWAKGNGGVIMAAISAIDTALWDIKGKYFGVPCYVLLGGKHRDKLRCYASQLQNGWKDPDFLNTPCDLGYLREACQKAMEEGYDAVKINFISQYLDGTAAGEQLQNHLSTKLLRQMEQRLDAVREVIGDDAELMLENHCGTTANTALQMARVAEPYDIMFLEEPASPLSPLEYERLAAGTSIPLATGERSYTRWGFLPLMQNGSLSVIQPDLGNCGGFTEGRKICDLAHTFGVSVQTHTCNTPISVAASLHMEAAIPNFIIHEHHTCNALPETRAMCIYDYQPVDGYLTVPDLPGIGNELTEETLRDAHIETVR